MFKLINNKLILSNMQNQLQYYNHKLLLIMKYKK